MTALTLSRINVTQVLWLTPLQWTKKVDWTATLTILTTLLTAAVCGYAIPILGFLVPAVISAMVLCLIVLALPAHIVVMLMIVLVLLIVGQLTYFLGIQQASWLPYLLLLLIACKVLIERLRFTNRVDRKLPLSSISIAIGFFCLSFFLSGVVNQTDFASLGVAAKNYIFPWFMTVLIASAIQQTSHLRGTWKFMLWMVVAQVPFAVAQHFYFATLRAGDNGLDAVVGSFGGSIYSGGASGAMAVFLVFGIVLAAALFQGKQISWKILTAIVAAACATVALAEVKIFFVTLPLGLILLFRWKLITNPARTIGYGMVGVALFVSLLFVYQQTSSSTLNNSSSMEWYVNHALDSESDPYAFNPLTKELSRIGAVLMWFRHNDPSDPRFYVGNGPAASRESQTLGSGIAARKYAFTLTTSTTSTLLWDIGLLGYLVYCSLLLVAGLSALRIAPEAPPGEKAALESIGVMLLLALPLGLYNRDLIDSSAMQTLVAFWIGYVLLCRKLLASGVLTSSLQKSLHSH